MRNLIIIISVLGIFASDIYSQSHIELFAGANYNFFNMSNLKSLQREILTDLNNQGYPAAITESFPPYSGFTVGLLVPLNFEETHSIKTGLFFNYMTTGGRVDYSDYSGELASDLIVSAVSIGGILSVWLTDIDYVTIRTDLNAMLISSRLTFRNLFRLGNQQQETEAEFGAASFALEPSLVCSYQPSWFSLGLSVSYLLDFPADLEAVDHSGVKPINDNNEVVKIDWSGLKFGIMAVIVF